jgi:predicted dehydrogenase
MSIRYGMIGGGPGAMIGEAHRLSARAAGFELVAGAFSSDAAKSVQQAIASGLAETAGYADWRQLIADARQLDIEALVIATPNNLHAPQAITALEAGLHVICDKPLATSVNEAQAIAAAAARANRIVGVTYTYAGFAALRRAAALVAEGALGHVRLVQAEFFQDWFTSRLEDSGLGFAAWRMDPSKAGPAGVTADLGTHLWQLLAMVTGLVPAAVSAELTALTEGRPLDDTALVRLRYANGARGQLAVTQAAACGGGDLKLQIMGDKGGLAWSLAAPFDLRRFGLGKAEETETFPNDGPYAAMKGPPPGFLDAFTSVYRGFASAIAGGTKASPGLVEGVSGMAFIEAALASSRGDGAWVKL